MPEHRRPRRKLVDLVVGEVSLVDDGDNPGARTILFKRRSRTNRPGMPGYDPSKARHPTGTMSDEDDERRRRLRTFGRRGAAGSARRRFVGKLRVVTRQQESGGASPHTHTIELPNGPLSAGTFRTSRDQNHTHDVQLPDLQPGESASVETSQANPEPPEGVSQHSHSVSVTAREAPVAARRTRKQEQDFKTEGGTRFRRNAFAFAPTGSNPSEWKLRLFDSQANADANRPSVRITAAAATALGPSGFRGQRVQIPASARGAVKRRVLAAWVRARRTAGQTVSRDDAPPALKGRIDVFDKLIGIVTKFAGKAPDEETRKRLFDEVRSESSHEQVVEVLMARVGDLARSMREILFMPEAEGESSNPEQLVKQTLSQFSDSMGDELGDIFAGRIVKALDLEGAEIGVDELGPPPEQSEIEEVLSDVLGAEPEDDSQPDDGSTKEEGMDLSTLSQEDRKTVETALEASGTVAKLQGKLDDQGKEIAKLKRAITGEDDPIEDPLEGLDEEVRKRVEPQLKAANEAAAKATTENEALRKRLDKIEADSEFTTFEKGVGDLNGLGQKREDLVKMMYALPKEQRETTQKSLEAAANMARSGVLFEELGSGLTGTGSAYEQITAISEEIRKANPGMSEAVAKKEAMEKNPELYDQYLAESN